MRETEAGKNFNSLNFYAQKGRLAVVRKTWIWAVLAGNSLLGAIIFSPLNAYGESADSAKAGLSAECRKTMTPILDHISPPRKAVDLCGSWHFSS